MLFDKLCKIIERDKIGTFNYFPKLIEDMKDEVKLFYIEENPDNIVNSFGPNYNFAGDYVNFFLPFSKIAIEDNFCVTLFFDTEQNQTGLSGYRKAIQFARDGSIFITEFKWIYELNGMTATYQKYNRFAGTRKKNDEILDLNFIKKKGLSNIMIAVKEVIYLNTPNRFILEERQAHLKNRNNTKKIPRSDMRPKFIFLSPDEIRKRYLGYDDQNQKKGAKKPHERRRHVRKYPDDPVRFPNAHGKTVIVPACWIGRQERIVGNKIYKVRLDI